MRRCLLIGLVAAVLLPVGACSDPTGSLAMGVRFGRFATSAIPAGTQEIRVGVAGGPTYQSRFVLSPTAASRIVGGVPVGSAQVGAVAYGADGVPLGGGRATVVIQAQARVQALVVITPGAVDETLLALAGRPPAASATPGPTASGPVPPSPGPSAPPAAVPAGPDPTPATTQAPAVSAPPVVTPTANVLPGTAGGGGGGALATPTPTATPPTGAGVTVLPGNPYTGPVTVSP